MGAKTDLDGGGEMRRFPRHGRVRWIVAIAIGLSAFALQEGLQWAMRSHAAQGTYFQQWSSETIMHTVSVQDLREHPWQSLMYLHIQPPVLDGIRAALCRLWPDDSGMVLVRRIDTGLYLVWTLFFALSAGLVFLWLSDLTNSGFAAAGAMLYLFHPAHVLFVTCPDVSMMTTVLVLWFYYELWKVRSCNGRHVGILAALVLILFLTKAIVQLPMAGLVAVSLAMLRVPSRKVALFLLLTGGAMTAFLLKNYLVFGLTTTSSFTGRNLCRSLGDRPGQSVALPADWPAGCRVPTPCPSVLVRETKIDGSPNLNQFRYLALDRVLMKRFRELLSRQTAVTLINNYRQNIRLFFEPSSEFTAHEIVDRLPWRRAYDRVFSYPVLLVLLGGGLVVWTWMNWRTCLLSGVALLLPATYIFLVSVVCEKGENMRFKYYLEPVMFVFLASQVYALWRKGLESALPAHGGPDGARV